MEDRANRESLHVEYSRGYSEDVDIIREREYPLLKDTTYLDHAGTTLYAKSLIDSFSRDLTSNLYGNPHSLSASSQLSTRRIDDIRLRALRFFNADPEEFDLVFVANTTAAVKLVADVLQDLGPSGFWYGYHVDSHTSLVGVRELAKMGNQCFLSDDEVDAWMQGLSTARSEQRKIPKLFAFPAQSNMNGRRLSIRWCEKVRSAGDNVFTLLDAASLVSTSPLDLGNASTAPDFTALSFYKIFGFPDLGALIVRKSLAPILQRRKYFGGGTVDMVLTLGMQWHAKKESSIHDALEDGTLPFHNIIALDAAFETHKRLYGSMANISSHTRFLAQRLHDRLSSLTHSNGAKVCHFYKSPTSDYTDGTTQGPIVSFNLRNSCNEWIGKSDVEKLAAVKNIQIRSGSLCNPGGTASNLGWSGPDLRRLHSSGLRCGDEHDVMEGRPTGVLRVSLGAMSSMKDIDSLLAFIEEFYVDKAINIAALPQPIPTGPTNRSRFYIERLCVYPIKSCGAFKVPDGKRWEIKREGLAWDREWCLIHQGTGAALSQKRYPKMALIRPFIDLDRDVLRITCGMAVAEEASIEVSLSREATDLVSTSLCQSSANKSSMVCGDRVIVQAYSSPDVSAFFSDFLGVPCTLARFPPQSSPRYSRPRHVPVSGNPDRKQRTRRFVIPGSFPSDPPPPPPPLSPPAERNPILLSNESPILLISRSSVNRLNETIKATTGTGVSKAVAADVFRGNIVVAENLSHHGDVEQPYVEDNWASISVGSQKLRFDVLGSCQRCQMVCVDQFTGARRDEPFSTLAKTRKIDGRVFFGRYASLSASEVGKDGYDESVGRRMVMVGDVVVPSWDCEEE